MAGAGEQHDLAVAGEHLHNRARLRGEYLVVGAVQQQQGSGAEVGRVLATRRLGRKGDDPPAVGPEDRARLDRNRTPERMPHDDEPACTRATREIGRGGDVVDATRQVVGLAVADTHRGDVVHLGKVHSKVVVQAVGRSEQTTHPTAAHDDDVGRVTRTVPEDREEAAHGVDLEVRESRHDLDLFDAERLEQLER